MARVDIPKLVRDFIVDELHHGHVPFPINDQTPLIDDGILDSLGIFSLLDFIEEHLGAVVDPEEITFENFETLPAIERMITQKLAGPA